MKFHIVLLVSFLIISPISGKSTCNDECQTKTYCLSSEGSNVCSKNNLVTAKWFVVGEGKRKNEIGFTLSSQRIQSFNETTISLTFQTPDGKLLSTYSCYKSPLGATFAKFRNPINQTIDGGSSFYLNGVLSCTWIFAVFDEIYPLFPEGIDLSNDANFQLSLKHLPSGKEMLVASDLTELPIYRYKYLECCYQAHGTDAYRFFIFQDKVTSYALSVGKDEKIDSSCLTLTDADGIQIKFTIHFTPYQLGVSVTIFNGTSTESIVDQLGHVYISPSHCIWSHPLILTTPTGSYDTSNGVYDVQLTVDDVVIYTEKGVHLKNSSFKLLLSSTSIVVVIISLLFNLII